MSNRIKVIFNRQDSRQKLQRKFPNPFQVNIEQDPDLIDPGIFGADDDSGFHRFEFNDYPSEVFYPNNDFYNLDRNGDFDASVGFETDDGSTPSTTHLKTGNGDNWIRKSFEQLTQNQTPVIRPKFQPRSKSLESETRTANPDSETDAENVAECDSFYDANKSTSFCCDDCDNDADDDVTTSDDVIGVGEETRPNGSLVLTKNVEVIGG